MAKLKILVFISLLSALVVGIVPAQPTLAAPADKISEGIEAIGGKEGADNRTLKDIVKLIVDIFLFVIGAVAVVMIIFGGMRFIISSGDAAAVKSARDTIIYSVAGLVVAILAYAIVNFVIENLSRSPSAKTPTEEVTGHL